MQLNLEGSKLGPRIKDQGSSINDEGSRTKNKDRGGHLSQKGVSGSPSSRSASPWYDNVDGDGDGDVDDDGDGDVDDGDGDANIDDDREKRPVGRILHSI